MDGRETSEKRHLFNAIILAEPKSTFVELMLSAQKEFQPHMWGQISIERSGELAHQHRELVHT